MNRAVPTRGCLTDPLLAVTVALPVEPEPGAVYRPVVSTDPHPGEQLVAVGEITLVEVACMTSQVTSLGVVSVVSVAWNWKDDPVATVAARGVIVTRIPESKATVAVPVFFLLALEVAVMVIVGGGFGTVAGAV